MIVKKLREDVWKFKGGTSVYLIKNEVPSDDAKWILIDAGDEEDRDNLEKEIFKIIDLDKIDVILLTHLHYDHVAGLDLFPNAKVFASGEELQDYMENAKSFYFYVNDRVDKILREKAKRLKGSGFGFKILKVPGHTRGSVAFLDEERKLLFTGDTIFGGGIVGRTDFPNSLPNDMDKSVEMLRKLAMVEGLGLCPGHGYWEDR
jgi:glyoxylase-like metal-dependent hydrolase (beta-lactamase superfamily II)